MFEEFYQKAFPFWDILSDADRRFICENSAKKKFAKGTNLHSGSDCSGAFFVCSGSLRAYLLSEDGKDITLYRLHKGEMCMLSASCVLQAVTFDVAVDAEEDSECIVLSGAAFKQMSEKYPDIRIFALETAVSRFSDPEARRLLADAAKPLGGKDLSPFPFFVILVSLTVHFQK